MLSIHPILSMGTLSRPYGCHETLITPKRVRFREKNPMCVQVVFKHALLRLQAAYPGEFDDFAEDSHRLVVDWTIRMYASSQKVPAAVAAAEEVGYNLVGAAAEFLLWRERADACRCSASSEECQCDGTLV
jgi:hypothetical protein